MKPTSDAVYEYDHEQQKAFYYTFHAVLVILIAIVAITTLTDADLGPITTMMTALSDAVQAGTPLGIFYLTGIGGYFIFTFPLEAFYANALQSTPFLIALPVALLGVTVSYAANYYTGRYLSGVVRPVLGAQSFYAWKTRLATYGPGLIVIANIIPMISQSFTAVLGVFRYNETRTAVYTFIGQLIKFTGLTAAVLLI